MYRRISDQTRLQMLKRNGRKAYAIYDNESDTLVGGIVDSNEFEDVYGVLYFSSKEKAQNYISTQLDEPGTYEIVER